MLADSVGAHNRDVGKILHNYRGVTTRVLSVDGGKSDTSEVCDQRPVPPFVLPLAHTSPGQLHPGRLAGRLPATGAQHRAPSTRSQERASRCTLLLREILSAHRVRRRAAKKRTHKHSPAERLFNETLKVGEASRVAWRAFVVSLHRASNQIT